MPHVAGRQQVLGAGGGGGGGPHLEDFTALEGMREARQHRDPAERDELVVSCGWTLSPASWAIGVGQARAPEEVRLACFCREGIIAFLLPVF